MPGIFTFTTPSKSGVLGFFFQALFDRKKEECNKKDREADVVIAKLEKTQNYLENKKNAWEKRKIQLLNKVEPDDNDKKELAKIDSDLKRVESPINEGKAKLKALKETRESATSMMKQVEERLYPSPSSRGSA